MAAQQKVARYQANKTKMKILPTVFVQLKVGYKNRPANVSDLLSGLLTK